MATLSSVYVTSLVVSLSLMNSCYGCVKHLVQRHRLLEPAIPLGASLALLISTVAQYYSTSVVGMALYTDLNLSPQQTTMYWMYGSWVYWGAPAVGWLSDFFVISGHRRRPTLILGCLLSALLWFVQWQYITSFSFPQLVAVSLAATLCQMFISIPLNGIVVEYATAAAKQAEEQQGSEAAASAARSARAGEVQSRAMLWRSAGSLLGSVVQTLVLIWIDPIPSLVGAVVLYAMTLVCVPFVRWEAETAEQRHYASLSLPQRFIGLASALRRTCVEACTAAKNWKGQRSDIHCRSPIYSLVAVLLFVFVYSATPDASVMYNQWLYDAFSFPNWFLSFNMGVGLLGSCIACELYSRFFSSTSQDRLFAIGCVVSALCYLTRVMLATGFANETLRIPPAVFAAVDSFIVAVLSRIAFMPVIHVASDRSPAGFEALVYELFSTASIGGSTVGSLLATRISSDLDVSSHHWDKFWLLLVLCAASKFVPLFLFPLLPSTRQSSSAAADFVDAFYPLYSDNDDECADEANAAAADPNIVRSSSLPSEPESVLT